MQRTHAEALSELATAARSGDPDAMESLLRAAHPLMLSVCQRLLPHHHDAEEAAQDALVALHRNLTQWHPERGAFGPWARAVASNAARSTYRRLKRHDTTELPQEQIDPVRTSVVAGSRVDLLEAIEALEQTHPATVEAFVLRDLAGLTYDEIAAAADAPVGTVKAQVNRARVFLRDRLG